MEVHLVELLDQVLPPLDLDLAAKIAEHLQDNGVNLHLGVEVQALEGAKDTISQIITSQGKLDIDLVLICIGIRPVSELALQAGIELGVKGAIRVDEYMQTNIPDILACGDCVTTHHLISDRESWIPLGSTARKQGRVAAETVGGEVSSFPGVQGTLILKAFDITAGKTGLSLKEAWEAGLEAENVTLEDSSLPEYYSGGGRMIARVTVERPSGRIIGAQIVGDYAAQVDRRLDVFSVSSRAGLTASDLASLDLAYAPPYSQALDIPIVAGTLAEAKVLGKTCSCNAEGLER